MGNDLRILVVAERATARRRIAECLREAGYVNVHQADGGSAALPMLHHRRYELLLTDLDMPGKQSVDLLRTVRADDRTSLLPVVLIGAPEQLAQLGVVTDSGANGLLGKPVTAEELHGKIEQIFNRLNAA